MSRSDRLWIFNILPQSFASLQDFEAMQCYQFGGSVGSRITRTIYNKLIQPEPWFLTKRLKQMKEKAFVEPKRALRDKLELVNKF